MRFKEAQEAGLLRGVHIGAVFSGGVQVWPALAPEVPPGPITLVLDDFNRPDEGPPPSANWVPFSYGGAAQQLLVRSNTCACTGGAGDVWAEPFEGDQEVFATLVPGSGGAAVSHQLWCCIQEAGLVEGTWPVPGYSIDLRWDYIMVNRDATQILRIGTRPPTPGDPPNTEIGDIFLLRVDKGMVQVWRQKPDEPWALLGEVADATYTGGYIGLYHNSDWSASDDFGGGSLAAAPPGGGGPPVIASVSPNTCDQYGVPGDVTFTGTGMTDPAIAGASLVGSNRFGAGTGIINVVDDTTLVATFPSAASISPPGQGSAFLYGADQNTPISNEVPFTWTGAPPAQNFGSSSPPTAWLGTPLDITVTGGFPDAEADLYVAVHQPALDQGPILQSTSVTKTSNSEIVGHFADTAGMVEGTAQVIVGTGDPATRAYYPGSGSIAFGVSGGP